MVEVLRDMEKEFPDDQWTCQAAYGQKALILRAWGKLDEAMALLQKQEQLKEELGDQAGLAVCWWNMGWFFKEQGKRAKTRAYWEKTIQINKKIGIPTDEEEQVLAGLDDADG